MKFLVSFIIWVLWLLLAFIGVLIIPFMLLFGWQGYTTIWGNHLYGKSGNGTSLTRSNPYLFLAIRNPVSNLGKNPYPYGFGVKATDKWPWLVENKFIKYGWAKEVDKRDGTRKFYFNPFRWTH